MSSTTQKHRIFVGEPMGEKPVTALAGVGKEIGDNLKAAGFEKASHVYGQYLVLNKNERLFRDWMKNTGKANEKPFSSRSNLFTLSGSRERSRGQQLVRNIIPLRPVIMAEGKSNNNGEKMSSTTKKLRDFVGEPMGEKPVTDLAGVGKELGKRLKAAGFDKAWNVLCQYLVLKKNEKLFQDWMKDICRANSEQSNDCYQCLHEWCRVHL